MKKSIFNSILFLCLFNLSFAQTQVFQDFRNQYVDSTDVTIFLNDKPDTILIQEYSRLFIEEKKDTYLYLLNDIAYYYFINNEFDKAKEILKHNIEMCKNNHYTTYEMAYSIVILNNIYKKKRQYNNLPETTSLFVSAIEQIKPNSLLKAYAYSASTMWSFMARDIENGFKYFDISNHFAGQLNLYDVLQENYTNAGNLLTFYEPVQASKFLDYALYLSSFNMKITPRDQVYLRLITGASYMAQDKFDKAIENFNHALEIMNRDAVSDKRFELVLNYYLISSYKHKGDYEKAFQQIEGLKENAALYNSALIRKAHGQVYYKAGLYKKALPYLTQFYKTYPRLNAAKPNNDALFSLFQIADCNLNLGKRDTAKAQLRKCIFYLAGDSIISSDKLLPNNTPINNSSYDYFHDFLKTYTRLVQDEYLNGENYSLSDVVDCYIFDMDALDNKVFVKSNINSKFLFSKFAKESAMNLLEFIATQKDVSRPILKKIWSSVAYAKNNLLNSKLSRENTHMELNNDNRLRYDYLLQKYDSLQKEAMNTQEALAKELDCYKEIFTISYNKNAELLYPNINLTVDVDKCVSQLNNYESVIDFYSNDSSMYYFTYFQSHLGFHQVKKPKEVLENLQLFNRNIKAGDQPKADVNASLVDNLGIDYVFKPACTVYFIPDGDMANFPIEVLKDIDNKFLIENNDISYLYSLNQLLKDNNNTSYSNEIACYAPGFIQPGGQNSFNIVMRDGESLEHYTLNPLPYSLEECIKINHAFEKSYTTQLRINNEATLSNFYQDITNSRIIHIATHGKASKHSFNDTGIFLFDNNNELEFVSFDKVKTSSIKSELIILSACKTAQGASIIGEGMLSLTYGFMFAGSKNVMASLWYVSDKETQKLMLLFYNNIINHGMNYSKALQKAKIECIKNGDLPLDWASFILYGKL